MRNPYPTDRSDAEWECIEPHLPTPKAVGRPRRHYSLREILDAVFYIARSGCAWRLLPHEFPPWKTITTTSGSGASTVPRRDYIPPCAIVYVYASRGNPNLAWV
jgi:transposase